MATILAGGQPLTLLAEKAAYLAASRTVLVADAHIGKAVSFRALGVPVPRGTTSETLAALSALVERTGARRVVVLGDFLHSARAHAPATLGALGRWRRAQQQLEVVVVRGNHDDRAGDPPASLDIDVVDEPFMLGGLALSHHPRPVAGAYVLAGHLHPCVHLGGRAGDHLRLPCFWFGDEVGVLPAFGAFTGMHPIRPQGSDRVYAIAEQSVAAMPRPAERFAA
ncbi:MAG TPA: ligase-associated DNA damage response endonuclease PdeM [Caldimonas sp.]|nr:ligase-associated DNA damage response endonuclease PdeM [Caldimonas sp.]